MDQCGLLPFVCLYNLFVIWQQREQIAQIAQAQAKAQQEENAKTLKPPKKPLTPYMRFSKGVGSNRKPTLVYSC